MNDKPENDKLSAFPIFTFSGIATQCRANIQPDAVPPNLFPSRK
jgi:hypothetical protein